jgi:hypothetical protein
VSRSLILVARLLLVLIMVLVVTSLALPINAIDHVRTNWHGLARWAVWVEQLAPGIDMDHLAAFSALGLAARFSYPDVSVPKMAAILGLLSLLTEIMQFWVPGRTPLLSDAGLDVAGGILGYMTAAAVGVILTKLIGLNLGASNSQDVPGPRPEPQLEPRHCRSHDNHT